MAKKHRKLFPTLTTTNQTTDCPDFCDPCPYNCYPYSDYYFLPPPPPPSPPPTFLSQEHHISPYVFVIVSLLAAFFLVVSYYVIIAKSFPGWCCCRTNRHREPEVENSPDEEFLDENRVDHPIWFITTVGLQQSIINSITICRYKKGEGLIEGTECSVCLSEFQQDETLRLLPKCNHAFHISCIDTWLRSHTNCPLCRAHIVSDAVGVPLVSVNQNPGIPGTISSSRMENSESRDAFGYNRETNEARRENRAVVEDGGEIVQVGEERTVKDDNVNPNNYTDPQILSDSGVNYESVKDASQPIKRSFSVDSLTAATMFIGLQLQVEHSSLNPGASSVSQIEPAEKTPPSVIAKQNGGCSSSLRLEGSSSIAQCLHKSPVPMKRSLSCAGRFLSSRQNRSLNSIIPL